MPYCIYLRKSRADAEAELSGEGETLARHEKALLSLAARMKLPITKIYKEIVSGETIVGRPQMQQLLTDVEAGAWEGVLVMEVERLGRGNTLDQGIILNAFKFSSTKIITPVKTYDPNDEFDEEYFEFSQFMSRREYKTIIRRMQRGREASAKEGKFIGSIPPYGYRIIKLKGEKGNSLEIVPEEAAAVRYAFELFANGEAQADGTIREIGRPAIAKRLDEMGFINRRGGTWATASVTTMLKNPVYCGRIPWKRNPQKRTTENGVVKRKRIRAESYTTVPGLHEPIVSEELWNRVQEKMKTRKTSPQPSALQNPLAGLVRCSYCGNLMQRRPYIKSGQPASYICVTHNCPQVASYLYAIEERILQSLDVWASQNEAKWESTASENDMFASRHQTMLVALASAEKDLQSLEAQFDNTFDLLEKGIYTPEVFTKRNELLAAKISEQTETVADLKKEIAALEKVQSEKTNLIPKIRTLLDVYDSLPIAEQNQMLKSILDHVDYHKEPSANDGHHMYDFTLTIHPKISKDF
jgi:DNA invertase Pin-like site-specific DNA recombinase